MATSLAQQLQSIRQTASNVNFQKRKKVASLIFDASEAADQDYDQVFALATNGFEEMLTFNENLSKFGHTIFSEDSRTIDRYVQTKQQNEALDKRIVSFIRVAAPQFLLRPMHKCLEWLIRRFDIHVHLADELLLSFMAFRDSPIFLKLLTILELPPAWSFLGAVRKANENPSTLLFIKHFVKAPATLSAYLNHVQAIVKSSRSFHAMITQYADISVRSISMMRDDGVSEDIVLSRFLPFVGEALSMRQHPDYQVANYMVLTVLSAARQISEVASTALMQALASGLTEQSCRSGLICLAQLCQAQDGYASLHPDVFRKIEDLQDGLQQILSLAEKYRADKLTTAYCLSLTQQTNSESLKKMQKIILNGRVSIATVLKAVTERVLASSDHPNFRLACADFFRNLQEKDQFSNALERFQTDLGSSITDLELALQITFTKTPAAKALLPSRAVSSARPSIVLEDDIAELPKLPSAENYLSAADVRRTIIVLRAATALGKFDEVLDSPVIKASIDLRFSFLIRAALSSDDTQTQVLAIRMLADACRASPQTDFQALIPSIISLLSQKSKDVRVHAIALSQVLLDQWQPKAASIWGMDTVYGAKASASLKWLSAQDVHHFLQNVVLANQGECTLDHKFIYKEVGQSITTHGTKGKELSHRSAFLHFLASHLISSPVIKISLKLLLCFDKVREPTAAKTKAVLPLLVQWTDTPEPFATQCRLELIDPEVVQKLLFRQVAPTEHGPGTALLLNLVESQNAQFGAAAIERLTYMYNELKRDTKAAYIRALIAAIIDGPSQVSRQAISSLDLIKVSTDLYAQMFSEMHLGPPSSRLDTPHKKQKKDSEVAAVPDFALRRFTQLLEVLERDEEKHPELLPLLFGKLGDLILTETEASMSVSYTQQILLSCMYPMIDPGKFDPTTTRIDILINCVRSSSSPQVHNRALLLVAALAEAAPEQVLHGLMPIFTFMGANVLRQDDGFSAHVIESTIQRVVPPLLRSLGDEAQDQILGSAGILRSFVDAFPHIPKHRRTKLFLILIQTMGERIFLAPLLAIFAEKRTLISPKTKSGESQQSYLEFSLSLLRQFSVGAQLQALHGLVDIARNLPSTAEQLDPEKCLFSQQNCDDDYLGRLKSSIVSIVAGHFASKKVRADFQTYANDNEWLDKTTFIGIVESLLQACEDFADTTDALDKTLDALERAITLLPTSLFEVVIHDLLQNKQDEYMSIKALDIVTGRASSTSPSDITARAMFQALVKQIASLLLPTTSASLLCSAWHTISTIGRKFGKSDPATFTVVVELVIGSHGLRHSDLIVRVSAIECLTTLCVVLGPRLIPNLEKFMPIVLEGYSKHSRDEDADLVPLATVSLLESLVKTIPTFMTPHTQSMIEKSVDFSFATEELTSDKRALLSTIATCMPTKNVLVALGGAWDTCSSSGKKPLMALVSVIEETIESSERKVVTGASKEILALFLQALNIRSKSKSWDAKGVEQVEKRIIAAFLKLVLKLNDSTFRPMFVKLRDWALTDLLDKDTAGLQCRRTTFFNFFSQFTGTFKSIVLNYFNYVIQDILEILSAPCDITAVPRRMWVSIITSLEHGFVCDNEDYWRAADKFDRIVPVLIKHLEYAETYPVLAKLVPAIVGLTSATSSEDHFKLINTQVLQLFRAEKPAVRLAAISTENKLSAKLGDEWLSMLPQTIPFIAEALEDEDEKVEKETHALAITIESFLGESLDAYLR